LRFIESTRYDIEYRDAAEAAEAAGTSPEAVEEARRLVREAGHQGASAAGSDGKLDFCFEVNRGLLTSPNGQQLDLGGQFVLQDLLALFAKYPDRSFSKEEIVRAVWDEDYDPTVHNNKLYVTIRRLRRMLQQMDLAVPSSSLIVRSKDGYRLDPEVHVQML
jgi:DNA-binding winged helix-turn-helix (wHTH) protein